MALPANVNFGTVVGQFISSDGSNLEGKVTFTPTATKLLDAGATPPSTIANKPVQVPLTSGGFTVQLIATDDEDLNPQGWNYRVDFALTGAKIDSFNIEVPQGETVDLTLVAPVGAANGQMIIRGPGVPDYAGVPDGWVITLSDGAPVWAAPTGGGDGTAISSYSDIAALSDYPTVFPSNIASVSGLQDVLDAKADKSDLDGKQDAGDYATTSALTSGLAGKAATSHTHAVSDVTGLQTSLDAKVPSTRTVAGKPLSANVTLTKADVGLGSVDNTPDSAKVVASAAKLTTARTINGVSFDGSANITIPVTLEQLPAGTSFDVETDDGSTWTYGGTVVTSRPTARTDLRMQCVNRANSNLPSFAITGDRLLRVA